MKLLTLFIILNVVNVILQTVRSLATIKCGKTVAALVNALAYGLYTVVIVYTNCDLNLWAKVAVVAMANLIGVYVVKTIEERARKDKLWKIEATFRKAENPNLVTVLTAWAGANGISFNTIDISDHIIVNFFSASQEQSLKIRGFIKTANGKYFASESKTL